MIGGERRRRWSCSLVCWWSLYVLALIIKLCRLWSGNENYFPEDPAYGKGAFLPRGIFLGLSYWLQGATMVPLATRHVINGEEELSTDRISWRIGIHSLQLSTTVCAARSNRPFWHFGISSYGTTRNMNNILSIYSLKVWVHFLVRYVHPQIMPNFTENGVLFLRRRGDIPDSALNSVCRARKARVNNCYSFDGEKKCE